MPNRKTLQEMLEAEFGDLSKNTMVVEDSIDTATRALKVVSRYLRREARIKIKHDFYARRKAAEKEHQP